MRKTFRRMVGSGTRAALAALALGSMAASCVVSDGSKQDDPPDPPGPIDGDPTKWNPSGVTGECNVDALLKPFSYGAKVKALLTGVPLEEQELAAIQDDPGALAGLIDGWLASDLGRENFERFFMTAFQQTGLDNETFFYPLGFANTALGRFTSPTSDTTDVMLNANFAESFARTAYAIMQSGDSWARVIDTNEVWMTTAQMVYLAFQDDQVVADDESRSVRTTKGHFPTLRIVADETAAPPPSEALDPNHPNFGIFWHDAIDTLPTNCNVLPMQTIDTTGFTTGEWRIANGTMDPSFYVFSQIFGRHQSIRRHPNDCNTGAANRTPLLDRNDFSDWRPVTLRKPGGGESASIFYDLEGLRASNELVLHMPRPGFIGSAGFVGTWPSNEDNAARVVFNQILIVALGASFEGLAVTDFTPSGIDEEHADPSSECYGCHQTLDVGIRFVRGSYTNFAGHQLDPQHADVEGDFVFGGVQDKGLGIEALAQILESHPYFPRAWAQKLCFYANSAACPEGAELDRVVKAFEDANLDFRVLVRELFASPLITGEACVEGVDAGTTATIARRSQFCHQLSLRLGVDDVCALRTNDRESSNLQKLVRDATVSIPDDGFSRAVVDPVTIAETGMFTRANREAACNLAALNAWTAVFDMLSPAEVLTFLVEKLMALPPNDPRHDEAVTVLEEHVADAMAGGASEQVGLQSAFVVACMSPGSAGVGF
ncbi:MAG: hypothetical protein R3B72_22480 [Polyangiaceae bacterium]